VPVVLVPVVVPVAVVAPVVEPPLPDPVPTVDEVELVVPFDPAAPWLGFVASAAQPHANVAMASQYKDAPVRGVAREIMSCTSFGAFVGSVPSALSNETGQRTIV
jgi:hypothetical protein